MMGRKLYLSLCFAFCIAGTGVFAQSGEIRGKISEKGTTEGIPFATVAAYLNGTLVQGAVTDFDGNFSIKPLAPGKYDVKATSVGYSKAEVAGILVSVDKITPINIELIKGVEMEEVKVVWEKPLIDVGNPAQATTMTFDEIQAAPVREVNAIAAQSAGVYTSGREGDDLNIRGSRGDATAYYVDGVKVRGNLGVSSKSAEQITTITGGVPAQYGDATGGIVSVTTRGPSSTFAGGVELVSSELFDSYGYNLASFALSGPILNKRDSLGHKSHSVLGYFIAGDFNYEKDNIPSAVDLYKVKDDVLADIQARPLVKSSTGAGFNRKAELLTWDDMETIKYHQNIPQKTYRVNGKLDYRPLDNLYLTFGGTFELIDQTDYSRLYELFNYDNNSHTQQHTTRVYGKLTQRFGESSDSKNTSKSDIKNAYYTLQADYTNFYSKTENSQHTDNLFDYGYVGKFTTHRTPFYFTLPGDTFATFFGDFSTLVDFQRSEINPLTANYTTQYFNEAPGAVGYYQDITQIPLNGGLINGDNRVNQNVYGIWAATGRVPTGYGYANQEQFHISLQGSADIKKHNLIAGMEYERRTDRLYQVFPSPLWDAMRALGNANNTDLDLQNGYFNAAGDTLFYNYLYKPTRNADSAIAPGFYEKVRQQLGYSMTDWVDIDALDPSKFNLSMFSVDELANRGIVSTGSYGYDQYGAKNNAQGGLDGFNSFLTAKDKEQNFIRAVPAFQPIYAAGYISDKFVINDVLIFNVGMRVDIFDANQPAMIDKYNLYKTYTAGELGSSPLAGAQVPSNIGSDYVVYVNDINNPTKILGYRHSTSSGDHWYDAQGSEINNVNDVLINNTSNTSGTIQPFLVNPAAAKKRQISTDAFKNYERQTTFMPRIAFSFPISDEAYFAAHYDILTQRPQNGGLMRFNPWTYYFMSQGLVGTIANPDLKPEKTTNYEVSFQQKLTSRSAFTIAAFYKEMKDMIQLINVPYAYPKSYQTFGNIDFGTSKGLTFTYDLRRTANIRMNIAYTLQFANGTGSSATTSSGLLALSTDMTNLREPKPLDFDQRHTLNISVDYHYGVGKSYNGPTIGNKPIFANAGVNILMTAGSGTPYTRIAEPVQTQNPSVQGRTTLEGSINGSRLPWQFNIDAKFDKTFDIKMGKKPDGSERKHLDLNVYLQILNLLDSKLVTSVYAATGNPNDDGYLTSPKAQSNIASQVSPESYTMFYGISMNNPGNYLPPRRVRLGVQVNF